MEYILGLGGLLVGAVVVLWRKLQEEKVKSTMAETKGKDSVLKVVQSDIENSIKDLDNGIDEMKKKRQERLESQSELSLKEREDRWKK